MDSLKPVRSGDLEAQVVVRCSTTLKAFVERDARRLGISTGEWWRRAAWVAARSSGHPIEGDKP
jgi:hypothetical protein